MKTNIKIQAATVAILALVTSAQAQFTPGNLVVLQVGNGGTLNSAAAPLFLDQFTTTTAGQTVTPFITIASDGTGLVLSGSASSEGALTRSTDGSTLTFGGYAAAAGTTGIASGTAPREVGSVNASGQFSLVANSSSALSGNNIRGAISDGQNYWITGPSGLYYQAASSSALTLISSGINSFTNTRIANISAGNLYYTTSSGTRGIYGYTGTPTGITTPTLLLGNGSSSSPYDFAFNPDGSTVYLADDGSVVNGGGIQKWTFNGTSWSLAYTFTFGTGSADGARQLTVDWSGANPIIYATTTESSANRLIEITDAGSSSPYTTLATAPANTVFRGVDFAPSAAPEPSVLALAGVGLAALWNFRRRKS